ncbi:dnaJ-related protein rsp1 [Carica papaya]|uniref:dnaJ-related protein rsp1 n=1 Tax=Carica papaya TaxID=3649 RepID=UPI000B8D11A3|nr:dnaJ-related protein rsp1 [Carica papaya]
MERESDTKSLLVSEICSISVTPVIACAHRSRSQLPARSSFVDWYRVLRVEEDAGIDVIRKQYHKLALQLHPDKNKHPKAEVAFKLVSEAYKCLSDDERRTAFNLERWKNFCIGCNRIPYATSCNSPTNFRAPKLKPTRSRSCRIPLEGLKDMRTRFKEEARVIQNCLKANNTLSRKESPLFDPSQTALQSENRYELNKESPVFDPSDYVFEGYPHIRSQMCKKPECFWYLRRENVVRHGEGKVGMDDIPVFRTRSDWIMFKSKSTRARS